MHLFPHSRTPESQLLNVYQHITGFREETSERTGVVRWPHFWRGVGLDLGPRDQRGRLGRAKRSNSPIRRTAEQKHRHGKALICAGHSEESGLLRQSCWLGAAGQAGEG